MITMKMLLMMLVITMIIDHDQNLQGPPLLPGFNTFLPPHQKDELGDDVGNDNGDDVGDDERDDDCSATSAQVLSTPNLG